MGDLSHRMGVPLTRVSQTGSIVYGLTELSERITDSVSIILGYLEGCKKWDVRRPFTMQMRAIVRS